MNISIIVYSKTGNTLSVAEKLKINIAGESNSVTLNQIKIKNSEKQEIERISDVIFENKPGINDYDIVIFGSYVEAFSLNTVMKAYLSQIDDFANKKIICFLTQFFPYPWMGGNRAMKQMKKLCIDKGGNVCGEAIINWKNKKREQQILESINKCKEWIQ